MKASVTDTEKQLIPWYRFPAIGRSMVKAYVCILLGETGYLMQENRKGSRREERSADSGKGR